MEHNCRAVHIVLLVGENDMFSNYISGLLVFQWPVDRYLLGVS